MATAMANDINGDMKIENYWGRTVPLLLKNILKHAIMDGHESCRHALLAGKSCYQTRGINFHCSLPSFGW